MRQELTLEEYTSYRKQYIDEAKRACHAGEAVGIQEEPDDPMPVFSFARLRFVLALLLLIGFLYCRYTDTEIFGCNTDDIISMAEEQQFPQVTHWMNQIADYLIHLE